MIWLGICAALTAFLPHCLQITISLQFPACAPSKNTVTGSLKMFLSLDLMTCRCPMSLLQSLRLSMFQKSFWVEALFPFCLSRLRPVTRSLRRFVCELAQCWYCGTPYMTCENLPYSYALFGNAGCNRAHSLSQIISTAKQWTEPQMLDMQSYHLQSWLAALVSAYPWLLTERF